MDLNIKILIIDDEERLLRVLRLGLKALNFQVTTAATAEEGLKLILNKPFDIILTDIRLGQMSGVELVYELERLGIQLPIIVMTAFADVETAVKSLKHGAADYIQKPFTVEELDVLIKQVLQKFIPSAEPILQTLDEGVSQTERELIIKALEQAGQVKVKAAKILNVSERTLWYKIKKYNI